MLDTPLYMMVFCTAIWCPLYERETGYELTREDCVAQMALVKAWNQRQDVYCIREGGGEVVRSNGKSWYREVVH